MQAAVRRLRTCHFPMLQQKGHNQVMHEQGVTRLEATRYAPLLMAVRGSAAHTPRVTRR